MLQIKPYSDSHLDEYCCYCGGIPDTNDHVPSKILLDEPFPENLSVVRCCNKCNQSFSLDEEYFACLIECVINGSTEIESLKRTKIKKILYRKKWLQQRLADAMQKKDGKIVFSVEEDRIKNVLLKLAKGHAKYENSEPFLTGPNCFWIKPITWMPKSEIDSFLSENTQELFPEVGSRALQKMVIYGNISKSYWNIVQDDNYQYSISYRKAGISVKILIRQYLACEAFGL